MEKVILDTDTLSEYLKGHDANVALNAAAYAREHGVFTFTSVTVHEIVFGLEGKNATAQLQKALAWLNRNEEITPTASDYLDAAKIKAFCPQAGFHRGACRLPDCRRRHPRWHAAGDRQHG